MPEMANEKETVIINIDQMLSKLWVDGDISSYQKDNIMTVVEKELR